MPAPAEPDRAAADRDRRLSQALAALAEPTRRRLFLAAVLRPRPVTELAAEAGVAVVNASHHLRELEHAGLLAAEPHGRTRVYAPAAARRSGQAVRVPLPGGGEVVLPCPG